MRQGLKFLPLCAALALSAALLAPAAHAAAKSTGAARSSGSATKRVALHQFTGVVTALDKTSITVEKGGKKPKTMVFVRHAEMRSTGEVEKNARVTVWYRDEDGQATAHRVVVKEAGGDGR
jgi:hypothetical protein